jgi:NAD(P)-dependent dehydrogenase (short-subunit alcohol dehydrogenase family)
MQTNDMAGKVSLVTGATAGIGKATARALASQGTTVIITGRNKQKAEDTVRQLQSETGNESVQYLLADFSDLDQVRDLAAAFKARFSRLDVLVNNAGAFFNSRIDTSYGVEMTFLVNHLAPFLLTHLLLNHLKTSPAARIINVSSDAHKQDQMDFDNLGFEKGFFGMKAYARSKLANILFTYELARRLENTRVTANALHPGHVSTDIWKSSSSFFGTVVKWIISRFTITPEQGADNSVYLATSPEVEGITGKYFVEREEVRSSPITYDENLAQRLWEISEKLTSINEA